MQPSFPWLLLTFACAASGCAGGGSAIEADRDAGTWVEQDAGPKPDASVADGAPSSGDATFDVSSSDSGNSCEWGGAPGECISTTDCASLSNHTAYAGQCPGPASIQCCITTPDPAGNPPAPAGYVLMRQADVTPAMTSWAVAILDDPATYPMYSTATKTFGALTVLARVEWHPPDFQNSVVHRGVTLYEPAG